MVTGEQFENWLKGQGYSHTTPSGKPSTAYDYVKRIERVCKMEKISLEYLTKHIDKFLIEYLPGGCKEDIGKKSHNAVASALKRFKEFLDQK